MIASQAGELVAKFIGKSWPTHRKEIYDILELGVDKAWTEGKWLGMTIEGPSKIFRDCFGQSYFLAPATHPVLLAVNVRGKPVTIRDKYFMFHRNGFGDITKASGCNWNTDVYDLGEVPYYNKLNINFKDGVLLGVRSIGPSGKNESILIDGAYEDGKRVYTYNSKQFGQACACGEGKLEQTTHGIRLDINEKFNYISNIKFADIYKITKTITRSPIEVIAIDSLGNGFEISRLEPHQTESKYRKYLVPKDNCNDQCVHGIFKIAKQETISSDSQSLIINSKEALICLAMGIDAFYHKKQLELGSQYILQGITILEKEKRETESPSEFPIQIDAPDYFPEELKYLS